MILAGINTGIQPERQKRRNGLERKMPKQTEELKPCRLCLGGHTRYVPDKLATALIHHCAYTEKELPRTVIRIDAKDREHCLEAWNKQNAQPDAALAQKVEDLQTELRQCTSALEIVCDQVSDPVYLALKQKAAMLDEAVEIIKYRADQDTYSEMQRREDFIRRAAALPSAPPAPCDQETMGK